MVVQGIQSQEIHLGQQRAIEPHVEVPRETDQTTTNVFQRVIKKLVFCWQVFTLGIQRVSNKTKQLLLSTFASIPSLEKIMFRFSNAWQGFLCDRKVDELLRENRSLQAMVLALNSRLRESSALISQSGAGIRSLGDRNQNLLLRNQELQEALRQQQERIEDRDLQFNVLSQENARLRQDSQENQRQLQELRDTVQFLYFACSTASKNYENAQKGYEDFRMQRDAAQASYRHPQQMSLNCPQTPMTQSISLDPQIESLTRELLDQVVQAENFLNQVRNPQGNEARMIAMDGLSRTITQMRDHLMNFESGQDVAGNHNVGRGVDV